jgi:hypothetical protein
MPKTCNKNGCKYNQFGGGYCRNHQYLRTDKKPKVLKKRKVSSSGVGLKNSLHEDWLFYLEIWNERPHIDYETGEPIPGDASTLYFHHVLPKRKSSRYEKYRHCKWNIVLVSWETHSKAETNIDFVPKIKAYRDLLLQKIDNNEL